jgi:hypothetical protein
MNSSSTTHAGVRIGLGVIVVVGQLSGLLSSRASSAQTEAAASKEPTSTAEAARREAWREEMARKPLPRKGCFNATYPKAEWQEAPCAAAPPYPQGPAGGIPPEVVGRRRRYRFRGANIPPDIGGDRVVRQWDPGDRRDRDEPLYGSRKCRQHV